MTRWLLVVVAVLLVGCATAGPRHIATVSAVSAHAILSATQDTEMLLVCGRSGAPPPPSCVPLETHRTISAKLADAFSADVQVARTIRDWPAQAAPPATIGQLLAQITETVSYVLARLPDGPLTRKLIASIGGVQ